ncbi:MAG: class SAM-dependent methyltransferase [Ferruginibacter sp.]|nr:class SAM-dependent methyltransferase [Ferruginibacter sp.]
MYSPFQLAVKYLKYYTRASNSKGHGVHSPFVFDFIKLIKNDRENYPAYKAIEPLRAKLLADENFILVEDFGAGSTVLKTNKRQVSRMAASSLKPKKFAQLLFRMVKYYQPASILELGTSFGITTAYLATANPAAKVHTLEGAIDVARRANENFIALGLTNIRIWSGRFLTTLPQVLSVQDKFDFVFVDGNHRKIPTLEYFQLLLQHSHDQTIIVFDDIHWSEEMEEAWAAIIAHEAVTLSIDLFFIGIVFLRKEFKVKQQFSIRF